MTKKEMEEFISELRKVRRKCGSVANWLYEVLGATRKEEEWRKSGDMTEEELKWHDRAFLLDSLNVVEAELGNFIDNAMDLEGLL